MKKMAVVNAFIALILLFLPLISAVQTDMKNEFRQGETLIAKISGNFIEQIKENKIYFYRDVYTAVPFEFELLKIEWDYYIYASTLNKIPGNYSLVIKDSEYYTEGGKTSTEDIRMDFLILEEYAAFSAVPGVLIADGEFYLQIQNLKDKKIVIDVKEEDFSDSTLQSRRPQEQPPEQGREKSGGGFFDTLFGRGNKSEEMTGQSIVVLNGENLNNQKITLKAGESKKIFFEFKEVSAKTLKIIKLSSEDFSQDILVYVLVSGSENTRQNETSKIKFETDFFNISMATDSNVTRFLYLINTGETTFENVSFEVSGSLQNYTFLEPGIITDFEANETEKINLTISSKNETEILDGVIKAKTSDGFYAYFDIHFEIIPGYVPSGNLTENQTISILKPCAELGGKICEKGKDCNVSLTPSSNAGCCLGGCIEKKRSSAGKIVGWTILGFLVLIYLWFYFKKYKKTKRKVNLLEVAEGKGEKE